MLKTHAYPEKYPLMHYDLPKFSQVPAGTQRRTPWLCQTRVRPVSAALKTAYL